MKRPSFQFYPTDWLSDPNVMAMSAIERGAYIQILATMWTTEDCSLRDDVEYLARLANVDKVVITALYPCFRVVNGVLRHKRLDEERNKQDEYRLACSEAGKQGMKKRWEGRKTAKESTSNKVVITNDNSSSPSSTSTINKKEINKEKSFSIAEDFFKNTTKQNEIRDFLIEKGISEVVAQTEIQKFISYWTEQSASGKERWRAQKFFDLKRRFATWFANVKTTTLKSIPSFDL